MLPKLALEPQIHPHLLKPCKQNKDAFLETLAIYLTCKLQISITYVSSLGSCQDVF